MIRSRGVSSRRWGFGLLEVLISISLLGLVTLGVTTVMSGMFKSQKRADEKSWLQNLRSRITNLVFNESGCTATVFGTSQPEFDPAKLSAFNDDPAKSNVTLNFGDGTTLSAGNGIELMKLTILNEALPTGSGRYEAKLSFAQKTDDLLGGQLAPATVPLMLTTQVTSDGKRKITGCYNKGDLQGVDVCQSIGGKWISSINRCHFGGDLKLSQYECISKDEFKPNMPLEGAMIAECYYKDGVRIKPYRCPNAQRNLWGWSYPNCVCGAASDGVGSGWTVKYPTSTSYAKVCDGGVLISIPDDKEIFLLNNELEVDKFVGETLPSGVTGTLITPANLTVGLSLANFDMANAVTECYTDPTSSRTEKCSQEKSAVEGKTGSCIFVNGAFATGASAAGEKSIGSYSGWIRVTSARSLQTVKTPHLKTIVKEASGKKCYMVKMVSADGGAAESITSPVLGLVDPEDSTITNILDTDTRWQQIRECVYLGDDDNSITEPSPILTLPGATKSSPFKGRYVARFLVDLEKQEDIDKAELVGGAGAALYPTLRAGTIWYFSNVDISNKYQQNTRVTCSGSPLKCKFTGWMILTSDLPDNKFTANADYTVTGGSGKQVPGYPCNLGVRLEKDQ